jgi:acetoin utilization protein AcuB
MIASNLLSHTLLPLRTSDTGDEALGAMSDFHVRHLPVVNNEQLLGLVSEEDILDNDPSEVLGSYSLSIQYPFVRENDHLYEVLRLLAEHQLTVIPVVDHDNNYLGLITQEDLINYFARSGSFTVPGSILILETHRRDYSLAEIARVVESEGAAVISAFVSSSVAPDTPLVDVTLKINQDNIQHIAATLERFGYTVKATFYERDYSDAFQERFDSLMTYLNV